MSLPDSSSDRPQGVLVRRPKTSIYTVLLLVALLAIMFGCLLMVIELARYGFQWKPPANLRSAAPATAPDVLLS
ncbi:MAG TPA: hypothetical protein VJ828_01590 [Lacipirellulaceae bacterium]|nr:hypothetical protein [Lacipirellulaceae bacterium]